MAFTTSAKDKLLIPSFGLVGGGVLWGLFWIPIRELGDTGLTGAWPGLFIYLGLLAFFLPVWMVRPGLVINSWWSLLVCGFFTGSAFCLYTISFYFTDVIRVLLLFYLTPVWSTILGVTILSEKINAGRLIALASGLLGLSIILGLGHRFPWPSNLGDWLALLAGLSWSVGTVFVYRLEKSGVFELMMAFVVGSLLCTIIALGFGTESLAPPLGNETVKAALPMLLFSCMIIFPMLFLTLWPARVLSPGRVGLLLMSEVLVGVLSAAWLAGEPFGPREVLGSALIVGAGLVEVLWPAPMPVTADNSPV